MYKTFTKDMLENGMVIKNREGKFRLVLNQRLVGDDTYGRLGSYTTDMRSNSDPCFDIMEVYDKIDTLRDITKYHKCLLWTRKESEEVKEVTMTEVEEKFGCKVKIVNG